MLKEHLKFKDFYYINDIPNYVINKSGDVINLDTENYIKKHQESNSKKLRSVFRINEKQISFFIANILAELFIPIPANLEKNKAIVCYKDKDVLNIQLDNLYWSSTSEQQNIFWQNKKKENLEKYPLPLFTDNNGYYPNAIECKIKLGYYHIPFESTHVVCNKEGKLFNLLTNEAHSVRVNHKGYHTTSLGNSPNYKNYFVHRIVALLFIQKPSHLLEKTFSELHVNHKNCIKIDNNLDNLEWVTNQENMDHARLNNLFSTERKIISKNIMTGELTRYKSISSCARKILTSSSQLYNHLTSPFCGRIVKNGEVFKFDDESPWPEFIQSISDKDVFTSDSKVIVIDTITNQKYLCINLEHACDVLMFNLNSVKNFRAKSNYNKPYHGYLFMRYKEYLNKEKNNDFIC